MRDIKFRAWDEEFGAMMYSLTPDGYHVILSDGVLKVISADGNGDQFELPVMQYTERVDCYAKPVYEGDIIARTTIADSIIVWHNGAWAMKKISNDKIVPLEIDSFSVIIGNIYQNPELINNA